MAERPEITRGMVAVTLLIFVAAGALVGLLMAPGNTPLFWTIAGVMAAATAAGLVIPIRPRPRD